MSDGAYRYEHFDAAAALENAAFHGGPRAGEELPEFDMPTTDGARIDKRTLLASGPALLALGSITCPVAAAATPALKRLHAQFGGQVRFVGVYVREEHPGELYPQPHSLAVKMHHAAAMRERDEIPWQLAVDGIDGRLHRALDSKASAVFLVDRDGTVAYRTLWSGDERGLREALTALVNHTRPATTERQEPLEPLLAGLTESERVLRAAGPRAVAEMGPMGSLALFAGRVLKQVRRVGFLWRTLVALATLFLAFRAAMTSRPPVEHEPPLAS